MLTLETLDEALEEAHRFVKRAQELRPLLIKHKYPVGSESAATKRASLDLTKALAKMRSR